MFIYDTTYDMAIFKSSFENVCRQYAGNIADKAEENFAFEIEFLLKLPDQPSEKSKIPFVNFLSEQNFDFCGKEKIFSTFEIFLTWKFFFQKKSLPAILPADI